MGTVAIEVAEESRQGSAGLHRFRCLNWSHLELLTERQPGLTGSLVKQLNFPRQIGDQGVITSALTGNDRVSHDTK